VNNQGQVAGIAQTPPSPALWHGFFWTASDGMRDLGTLGGPETFVIGMNNNSQVVGRSFVPNGGSHAFSWSPDTGMLDLGALPGGHWSQATALNDLGMVVGSSETASGARHAFLWTADTGMGDLGTLDGACDLSEGLAVSADGTTVVGYSGIRVVGAGCVPHAFIWTADAGMLELGTLPGGDGGEAEALAINSSGQVVGWNDVADDPPRRHSFIWSPQNGMVDLGTLGRDTQVYPGPLNPLNDSGEVVGNSWTLGDIGPYHGFLWTATNGIADLGTLGGDHSSAVSINGDGLIIGSAQLPNGSWHAVVWSVDNGDGAPRSRLGQRSR
jgi:probable HAF family extracellular repeat protein